MKQTMYIKRFRKTPWKLSLLKVFWFTQRHSQNVTGHYFSWVISNVREKFGQKQLMIVEVYRVINIYVRTLIYTYNSWNLGQWFRNMILLLLSDPRQNVTTLRVHYTIYIASPTTLNSRSSFAAMWLLIILFE